MALRYIDTNFFKSPYVRGLKAPIKTLYIFIICDCSGAGIWVKDLDVASIYTGNNISEKDFKIFIDNGKAVDLGNGKYFFPDFIDHQYPNGFSDKNPAQKNFISELKKYNLLDADLNIIKTLQRPFKGSQVMVMVKEDVTVMENVVVSGEKNDLNIPFENFWNLYDKKVGNKDSLKIKWEKLKDEERIKAMEHIPKYIKSKPDKQFRKDPSTYLNNKSFNDEIINPSNNLFSNQTQQREDTIGGIKLSEFEKLAKTQL